MSERLKSLREKRGKIVAEMRAITEAAEKEKRDLSTEELAKHGQLFDEVTKLGNQVQAEERQIEAERAAAASAGEREAENRSNQSGDQTPKRPQASPEYRAAFNRFLTEGRGGLTPDEIRALSAGVGSQGGFTIAPEQFVNDLIKFVDDEVYIRRQATKYTVSGAGSLGAPSLDADPADSDWTTELATGSEDSTMAFGKRILKANPLAKRIKVSNDLLRQSAINVEQLVRARLGYKFAITQEKAFLLGTGTSQPLGVFVASNDGIPTSRDISSGNTTTSPTFDGLIAAKYALKAQYQKTASWMFHRDAVSKLALLKDTTNQYLWQPSTQAGQPDRILGIPFVMSEYVPNTFTTGLYVGILGDWRFYWIADSIDLEIQRLVELYAETNQTGFIGRAFTDGQPVLSEAFVRVKLA